ncbi:hypothetical protein ACQ4PT_037003 [Festuca glaucescens]
MTTTANTGDPLKHPGFVREEEEEAVGEERYASDSDDDVDRYVFLARQPAPAESSDDDDAIPAGRKRYLPEMVAHALPAAKKARLSPAAPRGTSEEESGSEEPVRPAERFRGDLDQRKKNKKRRRCGGELQVQRAARGERSNGADSGASQGPQHRDVTAGRKTSVAAAEALPGAPRRFVCSLCGKCFGSYQALGGHVHLGHTKKARNAIAGDVTGNSCHDEKLAMADGPGHDKEKALVAAACLKDVDSTSGDSNSSEEMFIDAANHGDHRGNGNIKGVKVHVATGQDDTDGTGRKFAVGRYHELAAGANSIVRLYRCEVCGKECLSGQALGGHMRKHQKRSPHNGGKERKSPEFAHGAGHGQEKIVLAASPGESHRDGKKIISATACHQDVDSSSGDSNINDDMFIDAANHRGDGNVDGEKVTVATSHDDADGNGNSTERKVVGIGNLNSIVRKTHQCKVCGKECFSGKALGGHMRKHRKLPPHIGGKEWRSLEVAIGAGYDQEKTAVAGSPGESDDNGKKIISASACHEDVDSSSGDSNSNDEMFIDAANHRGNGHLEGEKVTVATSHDDADGNGKSNGTERKAVVGRCHELVTGGIGNARKTLQYRCEMCGKEYLSGQALGGHMRKHRKLSPHDGGNERRSPEVNGMPNQRAAVITGNKQQLTKTTNSQYGTPFDGSLIGWL